MKEVYVCKCCGFISTIRNEYKMYKSILYCLECYKESETAKSIKKLKK